MMNRMKLDVADLLVDSFAPVAAVRGDARAAGPSRLYPMCTEVSCTFEWQCPPPPV